MKNQKLKGNFMILLSALICGISFVVQSKGVEQIPPMTFNGIRSLLGGFALLPKMLKIPPDKTPIVASPGFLSFLKKAANI